MHGGFVSAALELDLPWDEIDDLTVVQIKQLGSTSRNSGNIGAELKIKTRTGKKHDIRLDGLSAAAYLIHERLNEARQMEPADLDAPQLQDAGV
jgi:hypothetical protein